MAVSGPVSFRVSSEERALLELLASARGVSLSTMARRWVMDMAEGAVAEAGGVENVAESARLRQREGAEAAEREVERWAVSASLALDSGGSVTNT